MSKIKLKLYVIGNGLVSKRAIRNFKALCSTAGLKGCCDMEVIDLMEHQDLAEKERILATPLLIRKEPLPQRRIIGDLSNRQKVLSTLELPDEEHE
ncbi:circadian clock protein KaiB [Legionella israelensis]|uniref:circadian clock KaiB family protein n=1 Tax=Legionella israelensis TaxID=454 RepID=UPI00117BEDB8|nr:circadian clock KaiB family protein [Legionella israelensis]QDP73267.1 circadian clock protein KaiB [Legionella israelensis]